MIVGTDAPLWFGPAKFAPTLATAIAGHPAGIFAPSLTVAAGIANLIRPLFPRSSASAIVIRGLVACFAGFVIILSGATGSRGLMPPMFAAAFIADAGSQPICREALHHGPSRTFATPPAVNGRA